MLSLHICPRFAYRSCICHGLKACLHGLLFFFILFRGLFYNSQLGPLWHWALHFFHPISWLPSCSTIFSCHSCCNDLILPGPFGPVVYSFPNGLTWPWAFLPMGSCVPFSLGHPWPICLSSTSSALLLTLYSHGLLLTSLGFPNPITSYSSLGFMGLLSIPYSLCLNCFGPAVAHFYFFHITHCPWVCYSLLLSFRALLSPLAFSRPIYLFHGPLIH